jgi:hypothetical protein
MFIDFFVLEKTLKNEENILIQKKDIDSLWVNKKELTAYIKKLKQDCDLPDLLKPDYKIKKLNLKEIKKVSLKNDSIAVTFYLNSYSHVFVFNALSFTEDQKTLISLTENNINNSFSIKEKMST